MTGSTPGPQAPATRQPDGEDAGRESVRRGDLIIIHLRRHSEGTAHDSFWAGEVTSITRDGRARRYRPAGRFSWEPGPPGSRRPAASLPLPTQREGAQFTWFVSTRTADVAGALATAACHCWPGHDGQVRPYGTLGQVRAALAPHLLDRPGWERLRHAARAWEDARRAAFPLLRQAAQAMGSPRFSSLSAAYDQAVATANAEYRHQHAQAARNESEG